VGVGARAPNPHPPIPNPQSPIPNPQLKNRNHYFYKILLINDKFNLNKALIKKFY